MDLSKLNKTGNQVHYFFGRSTELPVFIKVVTTQTGFIRYIRTDYANLDSKKRQKNTDAELKSFTNKKLAPLLLLLQEMSYSHFINIPPEVYSKVYYFSHKNFRSRSIYLPEWFSVRVINGIVEYINNDHVLKKWRHQSFEKMIDYFTKKPYLVEPIR